MFHAAKVLNFLAQAEALKEQAEALDSELLKFRHDEEMGDEEYDELGYLEGDLAKAILCWRCVPNHIERLRNMMAEGV